MENNEVLNHLMKIEAEASALVADAQAEVDRRLLEAEKQNHAAYDERFTRESKRLEAEFQTLKENTQRQYQTELDAYKEKLSAVTVDTGRFSALLNKLIAEEA